MSKKNDKIRVNKVERNGISVKVIPLRDGDGKNEIFVGINQYSALIAPRQKVYIPRNIAKFLDEATSPVTIPLETKEEKERDIANGGNGVYKTVDEKLYDVIRLKE